MAQNTIAASKAKGKEGFRSKLTEHEIDLLLEMFDSGMTYQEIAARLDGGA